MRSAARPGVGLSVRPNDRDPDATAAVEHVGLFRRRQRTLPLRPYEILFGARHGTRPRGIRADEIMREGWSRAGAAPVHLVPPIDWDALAASNRSAAFELHAWTPISPILVRHSDTQDASYLDFAADVALDWIRRHGTTEVDTAFAWYDMAIGARAYRLGYILDMAARDDRYSDDIVSELLAGALLHAQTLEDDERVAWHSNHGFYLAAGQLSLARRFPHLALVARGRDQALARLTALLDSQFSDEGIHLEHSPGYHMAVLHSFNGLVEAGLLEGTPLMLRRSQIEAALSWFVLPNGRLTTLGDTDWRRVAGSGAADFEDPALRYALSGGKVGGPPADEIRAFPASGYFVAKSWQPAAGGDDGWHLAQTAAFHSRTHKHADDLSFTWFDRGRELLVDPGRFGYLGRTEPGSELARDGFWYSDPGRVYVESTRSHNTVEIDGRNFERVGVRPFGSALLRWGQSEGLIFSECEARHFGSIRHARLLVLNPGSWLLVFDWLHDNAGESHSFTQHLHFAPELEAAELGGQLAVAVPDLDDRLYMTPLVPASSIPPVKGQTKPDLLGWVARGEGELVESWTGGYSFVDTPSCAFATLLGFASEPPACFESRVTPSGRGITLRFALDGSAQELRIKRPSRGALELSYEVAGAR